MDHSESFVDPTKMVHTPKIETYGGWTKGATSLPQR